MSPCTQFLNDLHSHLTILDSIQFLKNISDKLIIEKSEEPVFVHSVCSSQKMDSENALFDLVQKCSSSIETPTEHFCCGTGGDRIFRVPDLPKNAISKSISNASVSKGVSSSRTCELGLSEQTGIKFSSIESLVYNALKK